MKKNILFIVLAVTLIAGAVSFADTFRLGSNKISFNPTAQVTKTAAYTLTATDSLVNVTASSANITITLPQISTLSGQSKSYKILKTDATAYKIVVTPATGDTIGGESTRYLLSQNAYMVIRSGPGKNWEVAYETPYIVEDHEAGTYTTGIGSAGLYTSLTASVTLTASACGNIISLPTDSTNITLPATVANCKLTFITTKTSAVDATITPNASDQIFGTLYTGTSTTVTATLVATDAGEAVVSGKAKNKYGDSITIVGDGVVGWFIVGNTGLGWAEATP